jgi:hypothetical protein
MHEQVTNYIESAPTAQKEIMETLRELIHKNVDQVTEEFKWSRPVFKKVKDFAYLQANKNHVNLGFYSHFEQLPDPNNLLQGSGKMMRHIKIKSVAELDKPLLQEWLSIVTKD